MSRAALREAIKVLASEGLVEVRRKTGMRVNTPLNEPARSRRVDLDVLRKGHANRLVDLMEVRMLLEPSGKGYKISLRLSQADVD